MITNTKRDEQIMCNVTGSDGTVIHSANGNGRIFKAARESVAIAKGEGNARVRSTGIDESVRMYSFVFWEGEGNGDEKMIRG